MWLVCIMSHIWSIVNQSLNWFRAGCFAYALLSPRKQAAIAWCDEGSSAGSENADAGSDKCTDNTLLQPDFPVLEPSQLLGFFFSRAHTKHKQGVFFHKIFLLPIRATVEWRPPGVTLIAATNTLDHNGPASTALISYHCRFSTQDKRQDRNMSSKSGVKHSDLS